MDTLKLVSIQNNKVYYKDHTQSVQVADLYTLPERDLLLRFTHEDQEIITHTAIHDGYSIARLNTGEPILVPNKRQDYIFFFILLFAVSIMVSVFTAIRYIQIGDMTLYGNFLFFPLAFACTDIINELYGYNRVRNVIYATTIVFLIISILLFVTLNLNGHLINGENDSILLELFKDIPMLTGVYAIALLMSDSVNAFLFHRIKQYLQGRALWLRSIISTFIAHLFDSIIVMILIVLVGIVDLPFSQIIDVLYSGHTVKMLYALCSLPLIYGAVYFVKQKEHEYALTYAQSW